MPLRGLSLGHLHDENGLLLGRPPCSLMFHQARLGWADVQIGARHAAENESKGGYIAGAAGVHAVERADNLADGFGFS